MKIKFRVHATLTETPVKSVTTRHQMAEAALAEEERYADLLTILESAFTQCQERHSALSRHQITVEAAELPLTQGPEHYLKLRETYLDECAAGALATGRLRRCAMHASVTPEEVDTYLQWEAQVEALHWPTLGKMLITLVKAAWPQVAGDLRIRTAAELCTKERIVAKLPVSPDQCFANLGEYTSQRMAQKSLEDLFTYAVKQLRKGRSTVY